MATPGSLIRDSEYVYVLPLVTCTSTMKCYFDLQKRICSAQQAPCQGRVVVGQVRVWVGMGVGFGVEVGMSPMATISVSGRCRCER